MAGMHNSCIHPQPTELNLAPSTPTAPAQNSDSKISKNCAAESSQKSFKLKSRTRRVSLRHNPLKRLAAILWKKLKDMDGFPCSLLHIAKEITDETGVRIDKSDTSMRRIYDVVNVLEAVGLIVRFAKPANNRRLWCENMKKKMNLAPRKPRGAQIILVKKSYQEVDPSNLLLQEERCYCMQRLEEKNREFCALSEQLALQFALIKHNQNNAHRLASNGDHGIAGFTLQNHLLKQLHFPFTFLTTDSNTNIEISMNEEPTDTVHFQLDQEYQLYNHIQVIEMLILGKEE